MREALTWIGVGVIAAMYLRQRRPVDSSVATYLSAEREVDPTRWRHTGEQPISFRDGNKAPNDAVFEETRQIAKALGF